MTILKDFVTLNGTIINGTIFMYENKKLVKYIIINDLGDAYEVIKMQ